MKKDLRKKIDDSLARELERLGFFAKTEDEACKKLVAALEKEGIKGMEGESLTALIDMAEGFVNESDSIDDDELILES